MDNLSDGDKRNIVKLAHLYFQEGRWDNAIEEYRKLLELDPEDINVHNMLGDVYAKQNAAAQAYDEYIKVVDYFINRGQTEKVSLIHKKIARLDKEQLSPEGQKKQALIQLHATAEESLEQNKIEEAIDAFSQILKMDPEDLVIASRLAELEEKIGKISDAVNQYLSLGESFLKSHLFKKAQEMFKKVVTMDPQNMTAKINLAQIYTKQGSENDAKKEYLNIAEIALGKQDFDGAFEYANKAIELKSVEAHYFVGIVLYKRQKWAEAKSEFENLLKFKVNHIGALVYLARVYVALDQFEKAVEFFQKALKIDKDNVLALEGWVEFCIKRKNQEEASKSLGQLIDRLLVLGDFPKALEYARTLTSLDPSSVAAMMTLAQVLQQSGDLIGASDLL